MKPKSHGFLGGKVVVVVLMFASLPNQSSVGTSIGLDSGTLANVTGENTKVSLRSSVMMHRHMSPSFPRNVSTGFHGTIIDCLAIDAIEVS